jgi:hypothetical protein
MDFGTLDSRDCNVLQRMCTCSAWPHAVSLSEPAMHPLRLTLLLLLLLLHLQVWLAVPWAVANSCHLLQNAEQLLTALVSCYQPHTRHASLAPHSPTAAAAGLAGCPLGCGCPRCRTCRPLRPPWGRSASHTCAKTSATYCCRCGSSSSARSASTRQVLFSSSCHC